MIFQIERIYPNRVHITTKIELFLSSIYFCIFYIFSSIEKSNIYIYIY